MAWNQLAAELWTKIADNCDRDGVRALCAPEIPAHIRDSARVVYFRHLSFGTYNLTADIGLSNANEDQYRSSLIALKQERSRQRFTELPLTPFVRHVRSWTYHSILPGLRATDAVGMYNGTLWPLFIVNLPRYIGLTRLDLERVVIDDAAVASVNALGNLKDLKLNYVLVTSRTNVLHAHNYLTRLFYEDDSYSFYPSLFLGVCSTLTILELAVTKDEYRKLYSTLEQCHVLEILSIDLLETEEEPFERPPLEEPLSLTACPDLSQYTGPAYYAADIITGRPVHSIKLTQTPEHAEQHPGCIDWIREHFTKGTVPVRSFDIPRWDASACEETFPTLFMEFKNLESLRIVIDPILLADAGNHDDEPGRSGRYNAWHYLNILHLLSGPLPYEIPSTLRVLELVTETKYERHPTHTFDQVVTALRNSPQFANLRKLTVGTEQCFQTWQRSDAGIWDMTQRKVYEFDFDGEELRESDFEDDVYDEGSEMYE
ncbi:hypothetical protein JR316_0008375 [Psilocybe cubensis]|uniref:Uncharacterized protein n=2 Tax=Psilocybe cubensis TaxID=181762 RepID=A0A8H7XS21_PSICU|nr:hypothetical protein JR316_0008375 [Psilocybe cubensis]KAH9479780.1 hypothetical protein JR316_0008375 [Psilocybe cubensis]